MNEPLRGLASSYALILTLILIAYAAVAARFALETPPWQNPDEPAHFNYISHLADQRQLPALRMGDYDAAYLERLKAERFPPALSVEPVRYESHQPPLYYLLATPVYWLSRGNLIALRLFSAALGAGVVLLIFLCARAALPDAPRIALGAAAFAAFLPMHVAVMASVNNDALAELALAAATLTLLRWRQRPDDEPSDDRFFDAGRLLLLATGVLIGVGFLTKATTYIFLPVALCVVITKGRRRGAGGAPRATPRGAQCALLAAPALLLGLPWWIRNSLLYGGWDILGLAWHNVVVTGQPTTAAWIAENGWNAYWGRAWTFTAKSFWGVFGWLGVFMDARVYTALFVLSALAALGLLFQAGRWIYHARRRWPDALDSPWTTLLLLWLGTFAAYAWYNVEFIQHQGRYLFPAMPAWSLFFALGWWGVLERRASRAAGAALLAAAALQLVGGLIAGAVDAWTLLLTAAPAAALILYGPLTQFARPRIERAFGVQASAEPLRAIVYLGPFLALIALDFVIPVLYIVPQLGA